MTPHLPFRDAEPGFAVCYKIKHLSAGLRDKAQLRLCSSRSINTLVMENTSFGHENMTGGKTHTDNDEIFFITYSCILFATITVGLIANGIVIFLTGCRMKTTVNSTWFLNLAIADFIIMIFSVIQAILFFVKKDRTHFSRILLIISHLNGLVSICFLVVISLDRCLCTWKPVWALNNRTLFRARIVCVIVWVCAISLSISFYIFDIYQVSPRFQVLFSFTLNFLIPFLIFVASYAAIGVKVKRLKLGKQLRSYRLIITVIVFFFICWIPYYVCLFCAFVTEVTSGSEIIYFKLYIVSCYMINLNSCLNPFLYVFMCDDYKKKLKQSLLLVLETAFAEDHLNFRITRQAQHEQDIKTTNELL